MSRRDKLRQKLRRTPRNIRFQEIESVLLDLDFAMRQRGTSHATFTRGVHRITVPRRKPFVKPVYVKLVLEILDELEGEE